MQFEVTALYAAALGILTAGLGFATVITRVKTNISWGDGDNQTMRQAIRAHGNLTEYMPVFLIILMLLENTQLATIWVHLLGSVFVVGRIISALYFWIFQKFALRVIALWGAVLPIVAGSALLLSNP